MRRRKNIFAAFTCSLLMAQAVCLAGCGEVPAVADEEVIELIEPTAELSGSETVMRRTLYTAKTFEVLVDPYIEEYSYDERRNFIATGRKIGDTVAAGDIIYKADIIANESKIEKLMEKMTALQDDYAEYYYEMKNKLNDQYWELSVLERDLSEVENREPDNESSPAYAAWEREEQKVRGNYNKKELDIVMNEAALSEREELLYLDYDYYAKQVIELQLQNQKGDLYSKINGNIIYLYMCDEGDGIAPGTVVASVADMNQKRIVCSAIDRSTRNTIKQVYAFFNGKKYEVVCDEEASDSISTLFYLKDPEGEVPIGTYGNLVLYSGMTDSVLTVPREAVHNVGMEKYVYVLEADKVVVRSVKLGLSDGAYVEIRSGLEEGEKVFLDRSDPQAVNTAVMERSSVSMAYSESGTLYYPVMFGVDCNIEYGTVIFENFPSYEREMQGNIYSFERLSEALYMPVKAGDVIANVSVRQSDEEKQALAELENNINRAQERLLDLVQKDAEGSEKLIESKQAEIDRMMEQYIELTEDYSVTAVRTERDGRLNYVYDRRSTYDGRSVTSISLIKGDEMGRYYTYARIADTNMAFLLLPNKNNNTYGPLGYNTTMTVQYNNWANETVTKEAPVVMVNMENNKYALFLDREIVEDISAYKSRVQASSNRQTNLSVKGTVKSMDNVLLLPETAIKLVNSSFGYVNVLMEDGSICPTSVVIGRKYPNKDRGYDYCVIDGLTEGMTICWE